MELQEVHSGCGDILHSGGAWSRFLYLQTP